MVVCVCRGNILRSVIAEKLISQYLEKQGLANKCEVLSRSIQGTSVDTKLVRYPNLTYYTKVYQRIQPVLNEIGIDMTQHVSQPIDRRLVARAVRLIAMDKQTENSLATLFPDFVRKIYLFSDLTKQNVEIVDVPYDTKPTYSVRVVRKIQETLKNGEQNLLSLVGI